MPGWLARSDRVRAFELVAEFLRLSARGAPAEDSFHHACNLLRTLWEAEGVVLWKLDPVRGELCSLAASASEWSFFGTVALDAVPELAQALEEAAPLWVEGVGERWRPLPSPLLGAENLLLVPVTAGGVTRGCLLGVFRRAAAEPAGEELEIGEALAGALGWLLTAEAFREERDALDRQRQAQRRLASGLFRGSAGGTGLTRLVVALRELLGAEGVALYECQPPGFRQTAAAAPEPWLPAELPAGDAVAFPWERALAGPAAVTVSSEELAAALEPWLPQLARSGFSLRVVPLQAEKATVGVLLACGPGRRLAADHEDEDDAALLTLLAAQVLDNRRGRRREAQLGQRYQALFDLAGEGLFFLERGGLVLAANPALLRWTGYAASEMPGRALSDFLSAKDWEPLRAWLQEGASSSFQAAVGWRTKAGHRLELGLLLQPAPRLPEPRDADAPAPLVGRVRNAVRRREVDERLRASDARLYGLLDSVRDGVWLLGADNRVDYANYRLSQLFGVNPQELGRGQPQAEALEPLRDHLQNPEEALERWEDLAAHPDQIAWDELELIQPRRRVLERYARPLSDAQHRRVGRLEIYRDITSHRLLEEKVLQREKLATLGQLVSGIAHELNNPLTAVAGYAQLLRAADLPDQLEEKARLLVREAERAGRVVQNLLLFAREVKAEKQRVDLGDLLDRTLSLRAYELKVGNIRVVRAFDSDGPSVWGNPHQLQQVFLNLVLNAEQAIRSQRDHGRITVRLRGSRDQVRVEVADTGPGISAAVLPHIFDPFFTTKPPREGTGLGLSICQAIVKEHGGEIQVESAPGWGASFTVCLGACQEEAALPLLAPARRETNAERGTRRILVVDDEPAVAQLIADALGEQGFVVRAHTDSRRALAEAIAQPFHLIICDVRMPELDGPAFFRALREQQSALARRLIFTTGDTLARETADFLAEVHLPCLAKPFRVEELRNRVRELLQELEGSAPLPQPARKESPKP